MEKLDPQIDGATPDIVQQNVEQLKKLFPEIVTEGKIDFDALQEALGKYTDEREERYSFTWNGKARARRLAQTPSTGTLRPCPEESVNWDTTQNLFIEGDNLEVLKLLQKSYHKKVKMIYIDPPYNTGTDRIYKDDYSDTLGSYLRMTGQVDGEGARLSTNTETSGRYHTDWLNMMYPRLKLARNLLRDDGVILISIDDNEAANVRKLCDEVFGEENFVAQLVWEKKKKGTFLSNTITSVKEYVLVYAKHKPLFQGPIGQINEEVETYPCINASNRREIRTIPAGIASKFREQDYVLAKGSEISQTTMSLLLHSDLVIRDRALAEDLVIEGNWRYSQELMNQYACAGELYITQDLYIRRIVSEPRRKTLKDLLPRVGTDETASHRAIDVSDLFADGWGSNEDAEEELRTLMGVQGLMEFTKPRKLIEKLVASLRDPGGMILDFFAGSCTTAHAVMDLNRLDSGARRYIMVQLPESTYEIKDGIKLPKKGHEEAFKAGYETIAEIGKERIRRVINHLESEIEDRSLEEEKNPALLIEDDNQQPKIENLQSLDLGFKVFKLDASNINPWDADFDNVEGALLSAVENIKPDRREADVLYELLLKYGLDLAVPIEKRSIAVKTVHIIGAGALIVCLSNEIGLNVVEGIATLKEELSPEAIRVVFKDSGFADDVVKTNAVQILHQAGIEDVKSL